MNVRKLTNGVLIVVGVAFGSWRTTKADAPIADFRIAIAVSPDGAQFECEHGCAWKTLTFDCKHKLPCKAQIDQSGVRLGSWSSIYLTGGGLSLNRGGRDYIAGKLDRPVRETPKRTMKLNSPAYASALGLMDLVIDTVEHQH
jgi:hypothetical protein